MYAASFDYHRPTTIDEAVALLAKHGDDAKLLAGGHSLIPAMSSTSLASPTSPTSARSLRQAQGRPAVASRLARWRRMRRSNRRRS